MSSSRFNPHLFASAHMDFLARPHPSLQKPPYSQNKPKAKRLLKICRSCFVIQRSRQEMYKEGRGLTSKKNDQTLVFSQHKKVDERTKCVVLETKTVRTNRSFLQALSRQ